jgi:Fe-S cluster assembly protein SufD
MVSARFLEAAAALDGPDWLRARRTAAVASLAGAELPRTDDEVWRYSRIDDLDLDAFALASDGDPGPVGQRALDRAASPDQAAERAATVVVRNGRVVLVEVAEQWASKGLHVGPVPEADARLVGAAVGHSLGDVPDVFATVNDATAVEPVLVRVPDGVALDAPVVVVHVTEGDGVVAAPRLVVHAGQDSAVNVVEMQGSDEHRNLVVPLTEVVAARAARVGHVTIQQLGLATWQLGLQLSLVDSEATFRSTTVGFGGDYARLRTDCRMIGRGATGELDAVFFGEGDQTLDFRTFQEHIAPDCTSNLLFKGAVGGRSRSVYTGLIRVGKDARGTNAFQTNRNIKLSDEAWAESVPNLVIENNDVRCSHASAVGPIDEEQRFYLESRGVPTDVAERLIVGGFFGEVLAKLPVPELVPALARTVATKFERREVTNGDG